MFLNPIERIKMDKLKFLMIRQRCGRISPFVLKKTGELTVATGILYYGGTGLVKILSWIIQFCNGAGIEEIMIVMVNILFVVVAVLFLLNIILAVRSLSGY